MGMGERDSEGLSAQERLEQLRAQRMAPKDPGVHIESDAANGRLDINWNTAGAPKHHVSINLSRIVDAIPTVIRFLPVRIFTVWGLCSVWYRLFLNTGGDDILHTGLPAPGYSAFNPFAQAAVIFGGLIVVSIELLIGPLSLIIKQLIIGLFYLLRGSAATRRALSDAHAQFNFGQFIADTREGYHNGYSLLGSALRAKRGARNGSSSLDYGEGALTGVDPYSYQYDDGIGDRPSVLELTDEEADRLWDLYYPAYGAEGPMSNLHEALASGDPQDYTTLMSLALNVAEWCEQNGTPDTHGWFDDPAYPGDYVDAGTFYLMAYSFWERAAEERRVGPIEPLADDMSRFILRHLSDWSRENAHAYRWRGDWRDADYFDKDRL
jgi:hypothetical protein